MINNKAVSSFMENFMRMKLFFAPEYSRFEVCKFFEYYARTHLTFDDKMKLVQVIITNGKEYIRQKTITYRDSEEQTHILHFEVDPLDAAEWSEFIRKFNQEE